MDKQELELLQKISSDVRNLETHLISSINEAKVGTESVLKQLAVYLNISAKNLTEVHESSVRLNTTIDTLRNELEKIDRIESEILQLPREILETRQYIKDGVSVFDAKTQQTLTNIINYLKKLGAAANSNMKAFNEFNSKLKELEKTEISGRNEILRNQNQLFEYFGQVQKGETDIKLAEINTESEIEQQKIKFWMKIAGYVAGSGGLLYVLIDLLTGLFG